MDDREMNKITRILIYRELKKWRRFVYTMKYRELKEKLQNEYRLKIFERDNYTCQVCGYHNVEHLHLAHITKVSEFIRQGNLQDWDMEELMRMAYTEDNLITLCKTCHDCEHKPIPLVYSPELLDLIRKRDEMKENPIIKEWLELQKKLHLLYEEAKIEGYKRREAVKKLFREKRKERGWRYAKQKLNIKKQEK